MIQDNEGRIYNVGIGRGANQPETLIFDHPPKGSLDNEIDFSLSGLDHLIAIGLGGLRFDHADFAPNPAGGSGPATITLENKGAQVYQLTHVFGASSTDNLVVGVDPKTGYDFVGYQPLA